MTTPSPYDFLRTLLRARLDAPAWTWFEQTAADAAGDLAAAYTSAGRRMGRAPLAVTVDEQRWLPDIRFDRWTVQDAARAALLLVRADTSAAIACYDGGDSSEQESWLKSTALLPEPERLLPVVIDACRTNILPLFEAVACENPFPARYFPDRNFNQMVLKALFNKVALERIVGLAERRNPDLARMAGDYASERRAAGRTVPSDIGLAMTETP